MKRSLYELSYTSRTPILLKPVPGAGGFVHAWPFMKNNTPVSTDQYSVLPPAESVIAPRLTKEVELKMYGLFSVSLHPASVSV